VSAETSRLGLKALVTDLKRHRLSKMLSQKTNQKTNQKTGLHDGIRDNLNIQNQIPNGPKKYLMVDLGKQTS
jgi:hypothetical protein